MQPANSIETVPKRIFISYRRGRPERATADEELATRLRTTFANEYEVFIDRDISPGEPWAKRISEEVDRCHFLIVLLSAESVLSEMVIGEVERARRSRNKPLIIPVRVQYQDDFPHPLDSYLNPIQWASWDGPEDTADLEYKLIQVIGGDKPPQRVTPPPPKPGVGDGPVAPLPIAPLESPAGSVRSQSAFYVCRKEDALGSNAIQRPNGVTVVVRGPRQVGKSSLFARLKIAAEEAGKQVIVFNFQLFDSSMRMDADRFFRWFASEFTFGAGLEPPNESLWSSRRGNNQGCTNYVASEILPKVRKPLVLAIDETERVVLDCPFGHDFAGMLRVWHEHRANDSLWEKLDLLLVISTDPNLMINSRVQSPFNVGDVFELPDFDEKQVADLNTRHGNPFDQQALDRLHGLLRGHPYLTRRALYVVTCKQLSPAELFQTAADDRGPFGDHLRFQLSRLYEVEKLAAAFEEVIISNDCRDRGLVDRLHGAGLVREVAHRIEPRCSLYVQYFKRRKR